MCIPNNLQLIATGGWDRHVHKHIMLIKDGLGTFWSDTSVFVSALTDLL